MALFWCLFDLNGPILVLAEQFFKGSFLLFVKFDIMLGRLICLTPSCEFDIHKKFLKHHKE